MAATTLRGLLDAFVSNRMRRTAAEAERVPARLSARKMPDGAADNERSEVSPTAGQRPLDHGFITDENPAVAITRNEQGAWVVRDAKGQFRGAFLLKQSAVSFVGRHTQPAQQTMASSSNIECDFRNRGNPSPVTCHQQGNSQGVKSASVTLPHAITAMTRFLTSLPAARGKGPEHDNIAG